MEIITNKKFFLYKKKKEIKDNMSLIHLYIFIYTSFISLPITQK